MEEGCLHINLWHCRWTASVPKKAGLAVPKAWQQVNTLRGRSGPLPLVLQSQVGVGGEGCCLLTPTCPRLGSLCPMQELWAGGQNPWVLILVLPCAWAPMCLKEPHPSKWVRGRPWVRRG